MNQPTPDEELLPINPTFREKIAESIYPLSANWGLSLGYADKVLALLAAHDLSLAEAEQKGYEQGYRDGFNRKIVPKSRIAAPAPKPFNTGEENK